MLKSWLYSYWRGVGFISSAAALDQALEAGGQSKLFFSIIGKSVSSVFGNKNKYPLYIYISILKKILNNKYEIRKALDLVSKTNE